MGQVGVPPGRKPLKRVNILENQSLPLLYVVLHGMSALISGQEVGELFRNCLARDAECPREAEGLFLHDSYKQLSEE